MRRYLLLTVIVFVFTTASAQQGDSDTPVDIGGNIVFASFVVSNINDSGAGSLRQAITDANANGDAADTITFQSPLFDSSQTINLLSALPDIKTSLSVVGPGANLLTVRRSAGGNYSVFNIPGAIFTISFSGLTISNGMATGGNGGGGISSFSALTVNNCAITGNQAENFGGGLLVFGSDATVNGSTISGNVAGSQAGGIYYQGDGGHTMKLINSTVSANTADSNGLGGGIENAATSGISTLEVVNSTVAGNTGIFGVGGIWTRAVFSGSVSTTKLKNSIVANNSLPNFSTDPSQGSTTNVISQGFNLSNDGGGFLTQPSDKDNTNPLLGPLASNGGPTQTHALLNGSPAIDKGSNAGSGVTTDQRGLPRTVSLSPSNGPGGDETDVGAFEAQTLPACTFSNPIAFGQVFNGTIAIGDCFLPGTSPQFDAYTFSGTAGQLVSITMNSTYDTFLDLYFGSFPGGTLVATDDNGGGGTNARIPATSGFFSLPSSGNYTIVARPKFGLVTGNYTIGLFEGSAPIATVGGKVFTSTGGPLSAASVSITDSLGNRQIVRTNNFGIYTFTSVATGQNYTIAVSSKRFRFSSQSLTISGDLANVNFNGVE
ncbi:hypothetical protein BH10ACI2_BH10ACI2_22760 [soil metagenome]